MRKVSLRLALVFCIVIVCGNAAFCDSRYEYVGDVSNLDKYYIDTQSISYVGNNTVRFWQKIVVSNVGRNSRISETHDKEHKKLLKQLYYVLNYIEINLSQNTYRGIETIYYNARGKVLLSTPLYGNSGNIPPNSIIESARNFVIRFIQNNSSHNIPQPFIKPRPQYSPAPLPQGNFTPYQRQEWQKLQEYNAWLASQADFPEFNNWYLAKLRAEGVTPEQVNQYLINQAMEKGGQFTIIIGIVSGWYREFYKERYGGR